MKKFFLGLLYFLPALLFSQTSIYDIQYTTNPDDGTYPSLYNEQSVTTGGIVTSTHYLNGRFFISSSEGGAWNGLFVYDNNYTPTIGDSIIISGTVAEYHGYTEIKDLTSFSIISTGNPIPSAATISANEASNEAYEGVLVVINNCTVGSEYDAHGNWQVSDASGSCEIRTGIFSLLNEEFPLITGYPFESIKGIIGIDSWSIAPHPRFIDDFKSEENAFIISANSLNTYGNSDIEIPIKVSILNQDSEITSYSLSIQYDETVFQYNGYSTSETVSESGTITDLSTTGVIELNFSGSFTCNNIEDLIKIIFEPLAYGKCTLDFSGSLINTNAVQYLVNSNIENISTECDIPIGDTLTVVQRPILNIPSIVIPRERLNIECFAPESTTDWNVEILFGNMAVPLSTDNSVYDEQLDKWTVTVTIPNVEFYELYDLRVTASNGLVDTVKNAVRVIDKYKTDYYFVHITDLHLPTHEFYPEGTTDTTELNDLYEVIQDINLINPEFVLITGDLINEGELEDFECRRNHTRSIRMLELFEVPVYIVSGNHDLGGWDATPPSQGTARREWWRFFGWRQRDLSAIPSEFLTQNYSFDYGEVHYVGLEAYINYDKYMYSTYGGESFIPEQITWLKNDLQGASDKKKVLFYHYDFKSELNLTTLGVDMALWGHTHRSSGSESTHPYNLSTASVCDGKRAYRLISVIDNNLQAESPIATHTSGDMLSLNYNMENKGNLDSISATIRNNFPIPFEQGLVKFIMPHSEYGYQVTNGELLQELTFDEYVVCYVKIDIPANSSVTVSISKDTFEEEDFIYDIQISSIRQGSIKKEFTSSYLY